MAVETLPLITTALLPPSERRGPPVRLPDLSIPFEDRMWNIYMLLRGPTIITNGTDPTDYGTVVDELDINATPDLSQLEKAINTSHLQTTHFLWEHWSELARLVSDPDEEIVSPMSFPEVAVPTIETDGREGTGRADVIGIDYEGRFWVVEIGRGLKVEQLKRYQRGLGRRFPGHKHHGIAVKYNAGDFAPSSDTVNLRMRAYR